MNQSNLGAVSDLTITDEPRKEGLFRAYPAPAPHWPTGQTHREIGPRAVAAAVMWNHPRYAKADLGDLMREAEAMAQRMERR